jgi:carbohydrate-selective porin OprB
MRKFRCLAISVFIFGLLSNVAVQAKENNSILTDFWQCASPTDGFWGLNDALAGSGIEIGVGLTSVYQSNVHGGLSTSQKRGRYFGRYDVELSADLQKLFGFESGSLFIHGWGGWPDTEGVDGHSVGSAWGINALSVGNRSMDIVEFFYEGSFFSDDWTLAIGKMDFTGIFDASEYADDECSQFLNASLVDDPAIPFPQQGLGVVLNWDISDNWYLMGGVADAQADSREMGFRTTFHDEDYFFYAVETGKRVCLNSDNGPMDGTYRFGMWIDGQDKLRFSNNQVHRDDTGFYTSCDQMLYKENGDSDDTQGLGGFFRYGWADSSYNSVINFVSLGFQYQGLFESRDEDVLGVGFSRGFFSNKDSGNYPEDYESVLEAYYNLQVSRWFVVSPNVQYVANPSDGAGTKTSDAVIAGVRLAVTF